MIPIRDIEWVWLAKLAGRPIDFFPPRPTPIERLAEAGEICIATKSRALGDALALTGLPAKLRARYPGLRVTTYARGFNPVVFRGNPAVEGVSRLPRAVWGDDCNWGSGQLIQLKERFFDLPVSERPRPEIHLLPAERERARAVVADKTLEENERKPLVILHPWGRTNAKVAPAEFWDAIVQRWSDRFRFWQVGVEGHAAIQGCEFYFLQRPGRWKPRELFALVAEARAFLGVDSGPMHVARAFDLPSLVFVQAGPEAAAALARREEPYYLRGNWRFSTLYAENRHVGLPCEPRAADGFFESLA